MKNSIQFIILFLTFSTVCLGQLKPIEDQSGKAKIEFVREVEGSKDALYLRAKTWIYKTFKSGDDVIQVEDKEEGVIVGKGNTGSLVYNNMGIKKDGGSFEFNLTIQVKDNKYKVTIDEITYKEGEMIGLKSGADYNEEYPSTWSTFGKKFNQKRWEEMKGQALDVFTALVATVEDNMKKSKLSSDF